MGLNIKRPETEAAIRELAARDGVSLTKAVETAVKEALARRNDERDLERSRVERELADIIKLARSVPEHARVPMSDDELYGPDGMS